VIERRVGSRRRVHRGDDEIAQPLGGQPAVTRVPLNRLIHHPLLVACAPPALAVRTAAPYNADRSCRTSVGAEPAFAGRAGRRGSNNRSCELVSGNRNGSFT